MTGRLRWQLSAMMFLQYAVWGAWAPVISVHFQNLGIMGIPLGYIFGTMALAAMLTPFIAGQIADRYFATQRFLAFCHIVGGVLLIIAATRTTFPILYALMLGNALLYAPTLALTNSLAFHHLPDAQKTFPSIRIWGTISWVAVGWLFGLWLGNAAVHWSWVNVGNSLVLGGGLGVVLGLFCLTLPHTPPAREAKNPWAFLQAFSLVRQRNFGVLFVVSFLVATELAFYYQLTPIFFKDQAGLGLPEAWVGPVMTIGQMAEALVMLALPFSLKRFGMRTTIGIGIATWPVRYLIFAIGHPTPLVIAAQSLHGVCYAFFFVAGQVYANEVAQGDIRASAQSLLLFVTQGAGMFLGSIFAGWAQAFFHGDFHKIFLVPVAITGVCCVAFLIGFSERVRLAQLAAQQQSAPAGRA